MLRRRILRVMRAHKHYLNIIVRANKLYLIINGKRATIILLSILLALSPLSLSQREALSSLSQRAATLSSLSLSAGGRSLLSLSLSRRLSCGAERGVKVRTSFLRANAVVCCLCVVVPL